MQIPIHFTPRWYQIEAIQALENGVKFAVWCWSRRGGKDLTAFNYAVKKMVDEPMNVVLVFPTMKQGKDAFWDNLENDGFRTLDHIPKSLIDRQDNNTMRIGLKNGSTFQILGTTDPDALRGANGKIYIFSEFVDEPDSALEVVRPVVAVNGGQIIIISTPKIDGISGATFERLYKRALDNWTKGPKTQFASLITAHEYLSAEVLEELRQESIEKWGNDFFFRQEYLCDFGQVSSSSYYGGVLKVAEAKGRIGHFPYDSAFPAYSAWDLGISDSTAITMFQYIKKQPRIIDYFEINDIANEPIVRYIQSKPYNFGWHFFPHDGSVRDSDAVQRIEKIRDLGLVNSSLLIREPVDDGIKRVVEQLATTEWNEGTTTDLRKKLMMYQRKFNALTGDYMGPEHKTVSHAADSVRAMYKAIESDFDPETGEFLYSPANVQSSYGGEAVKTPGLFRPYGY